ncbi:MAG: amidohydrolase [Candidatus Heimdallarchaeota archaeon]|nr:amidohydrolase [Candidatus Heimdallarchaeota archaeon]
MSVISDSQNLREKLVGYRRFFHIHPEIGMKEFETSMYIKEKLVQLGQEYKEYAVTGITVRINGTKGQGKTLLIRADIDALPLQEKNDVPYKSQTNGMMHACGHDTHAAILLGVVEILNARRNEFSGSVLLVFQPGEEGFSGASKMIAEGAVGDIATPTHDAAIALHATPAPVGTIGSKEGHMTSAADQITIRVKGKEDMGVGLTCL